MKRFFFVAALLGLLSVAGRAEADTVYMLSGTFGSTGTGDNPVPGGSFSGTYETGDLPLSSGQRGSSDIFDVSIYTATGSLFENYDSTTADVFGTLKASASGVNLEFANHSDSSDLYLTFAAGFDGVGQVLISESATLGSFYKAPTFGDLTYVASGESSLSVPEPSSLVLTGTAALAGLGLWARRRRRS
jgi:hypothetical protein